MKIKLTKQEAFERKQAHAKAKNLGMKVVRSTVVYTAPFKGICVGYTFSVVSI